MQGNWCRSARDCLDGHLRAAGETEGLDLKGSVSSDSQGYVGKVKTILILGHILVNSGREYKFKMRIWMIHERLCIWM